MPEYAITPILQVFKYKCRNDNLWFKEALHAAEFFLNSNQLSVQHFFSVCVDIPIREEEKQCGKLIKTQQIASWPQLQSLKHIIDWYISTHLFLVKKVISTFLKQSKCSFYSEMSCPLSKQAITITPSPVVAKGCLPSQSTNHGTVQTLCPSPLSCITLNSDITCRPFHALQANSGYVN